MRGYIYKHHKDKTVLTVMKDGQTLREVEFFAGKEYVVNPDNKQKLKNRGRKVLLNAIESKDGVVMAKVKYLDTSRPGRVELDDLDNISIK
jgi:hypothetical protein